MTQGDGYREAEVRHQDRAWKYQCGSELTIRLPRVYAEHGVCDDQGYLTLFCILPTDHLAKGSNHRGMYLDWPEIVDD